tara:strand:+ start:199 stop:375 length:177 start_codon:yes stop_codon:yes gene_type:complete
MVVVNVNKKYKLLYMDIEEFMELEDLVAWELSFNIPAEETLKDLGIEDPEILDIFLKI